MSDSLTEAPDRDAAPAPPKGAPASFRTSRADLLLLSLGHAVTDIYSNFLPGLIVFIQQNLALSNTLVGVLATVVSLSGSMTQILFGYLADRVQRAWFLVLGPLAAAFFMSLIGGAHSLFLLILLLALGGCGVSCFHPQAAVAAGSGDKRRRGLDLAIFVTAGSAGYSLGPLAATAAAQRFGLSGMWVVALPGLLMALVLRRTVYSRVSGRAGERENGRVGERRNGRVGERENGRVGERENGRVGERENGRVGERENGRVGEWESGRPASAAGAGPDASSSPTPPLPHSPIPSAPPTGAGPDAASAPTPPLSHSPTPCAPPAAVGQHSSTPALQHSNTPVRRAILALWAIVSLRSAVNIGLVNFMPLFLKERGHTPSYGSAAVSAFLFAGAVGGMVGGSLSDRWGRRRVLAASLAFSSPLLLALPMVPERAFLGVLIAAGLVLSASAAVNVAMAQEIAPARQGTASAMVQGCAFGTGGLLAVLAGALADRTSIGMVYQALALLPLLALPVAFLLPETVGTRRRP